MVEWPRRRRRRPRIILGLLGFVGLADVALALPDIYLVGGVQGSPQDNHAAVVLAQLLAAGNVELRTDARLSLAFAAVALSASIHVSVPSRATGLPAPLLPYSSTQLHACLCRGDMAARPERSKTCFTRA
jgi:hypothetical protein